MVPPEIRYRLERSGAGCDRCANAGCGEQSDELDQVKGTVQVVPVRAWDFLTSDDVEQSSVKHRADEKVLGADESQNGDGQ